MVQAEFLNGTKTSGHVQFETCEVHHGVLVLFCQVSLSIATLDTARSPFRPSQATEKVCQPWKMSNS